MIGASAIIVKACPTCPTGRCPQDALIMKRLDIVCKLSTLLLHNISIVLRPSTTLSVHAQIACSLLTGLSCILDTCSASLCFFAWLDFPPFCLFANFVSKYLRFILCSLSPVQNTQNPIISKDINVKTFHCTELYSPWSCMSSCKEPSNGVQVHQLTATSWQTTQAVQCNRLAS